MSEFNWNPLHNLPCTSYLPAYRRQGTLYIILSALNPKHQSRWVFEQLLHSNKEAH
jgi:hypothetical protein